MIEETRDFRRINRFSDRQPNLAACIRYLLEVQGGQDMGVWIAHPYRDGVMIHADTNLRGKQAKRSCREALEWIFTNMSFNVVYAAARRGNERVGRFACSMGARRFCEDNEHVFYKITADELRNGGA